MKQLTFITPKLIAIPLMVFSFISCGNQKVVSNKEIPIEAEPKMLFINYSLSKINNNINSKNLLCISKIITDGVVKKKPNLNINTGLPGDLVCSQLGKRSNILQSILIKNPLVKLIEYADENKLLHKKQIELDSARFSLRLQLHANTKFIFISNYNEAKPLLITEISQSE